MDLLWLSERNCVQVKRYWHIPKQSDECYWENISRVVHATCERYFVEHLVWTKRARTKYSKSPRKTFTYIFLELRVVLRSQCASTMEYTNDDCDNRCEMCVSVVHCGMLRSMVYQPDINGFAYPSQIHNHLLMKFSLVRKIKITLDLVTQELILIIYFWKEDLIIGFAYLGQQN